MTDIDAQAVFELATVEDEQSIEALASVVPDDVRARTEASPFARAFFTLVEGRAIVEPSAVESY